MSYPRSSAERTSWVLEQRGAKSTLDPGRAYAIHWEEEPDDDGGLQPTAVVFLTNQECPFHCVMCDLWVNTLDTPVAPGAIVAQIQTALAAVPAATAIKLYNAGSFFDPAAIPPEDDEAIAVALEPFDRVIVESHPAFLAGTHGERCLRFRDRLRGRLEVAVGLETAHPEVLAALNKQMTLDTFRRAAEFLQREGMALRTFILLQPPFMDRDDAVEWACRSIDLSIECGAAVCSVIPTRGGNGAMEALGSAWSPPRLPSLEAVIGYGLGRGGCRVFADLWDVGRFFDCSCSPARAARLQQMNRDQRIAPTVVCGCDGH